MGCANDFGLPPLCAMEDTLESYPFGIAAPNEPSFTLAPEHSAVGGTAKQPWVPESPRDVIPLAFRPSSRLEFVDRPGSYRYPSSSFSSREVQGLAGKVAIPRITCDSSKSQVRRCTKACGPCRQRKIKCDGNKPVCRPCVGRNVSCFYTDVKRVRDRKQLSVLQRKVEQYKRLLRDLEEVDGDVARRVRTALRGFDATSATADDGDSDSSNSSVGSLNGLDLVQEDLNRSEKSVATGFFGKNSEIAWMQGLEDEAKNRSWRKAESLDSKTSKTVRIRLALPYSQMQRTEISAITFYLDDISLPLLDSVDPYELPPKDLANQFFTAYVESVHPSFNVRFFNQPTHPSRRWLAILNMIFAIGCRYYQAMNSRADGDYDDLVYMNRARKLALDEDYIFKHANLQQIQVEAFTFSGIAFRSAISLGINLRFSIFLLEHLLTAVTGRASYVGESLSATRLPIPFEEETFGRSDILSLFQDSVSRIDRLKLTLLQTEEEARASMSWLASCESSPSLFFHCLVDLAAIGQDIIINVYSIQGVHDCGSQIKQRIRKYSSILNMWLSKVPEAYRFTSVNSDGVDIPGSNNSQWKRERIFLAMNYYSTRIMLCRPCLTHTGSPLSIRSADPEVAQHSCPISRPNSSSCTQFRSSMALMCIRSARSLLACLPQTPDIMWITAMTPWWCILHYIMQATTAILCHLSSWPPGPSEHPAHPVFSDLGSTVREIKKAMRWLHHMAYTHAAPGRAFRQCNSILQLIFPIAETTGEDVSHLISSIDERKVNKVQSARDVSAPHSN
ncbi:C6 transcription factor [Aspergillus phoenicis ATCC 13157]|uniref:C6 transcription factor n=1 Tax=Aspergillus phoenicis ATCC 13157 TaxID=1353007 RepID=A0A370PFY4_ASPPH|nr:C6 transcription factor [Aspergillus phoenicis ATCC 13157]